MAGINLNSLPSAGERFKLSNKLNTGVCGILYEAEDKDSGNKKVMVRVANLTKERMDEVKEELKVCNSLKVHPNIATFLGGYKKQGKNDIQQALIVNEFCEGGTLANYVRQIVKKNRRVPEEHISYILYQLIKAVVHLHNNNVIHRNIRADNIMLTPTGDIKLTNLGLSTQVSDAEQKLQTCLGSPCWMAPEVAACKNKVHNGYDLRADVWAIGVTAIEIGDGKPPLQNIHPARALFQITRNPPPTLFRPSNWSQLFNDFIAECLEKNPDNRPFSQELLEHPFFEYLSENENQVLRQVREIVIYRNKIKEQIVEQLSRLQSEPRQDAPFADVVVRGQFMEQEDQSPQKMLQEDLAAMEDLSDDKVVDELQNRAKFNQFYTFAGDVLVAVNPHQNLDIYGLNTHVKYQFKSRSDNAPHIYTIADKAYQDVLHNEEPQHILLAGETMSGKTTNARHVIEHLLYLGKGNACAENITKAHRVLRALGNATTPQNADSTRHLQQTQITFTSTGKVSGAIFWVYLLEKSRVTMDDKKQANFHAFYYFYDCMEADGTLGQFNLEGGRNYNYLRSSGTCARKGPRETSEDNRKQWKNFEQDLQDLGIESKNLEIIKNVFAAILLLGEVIFEQDDEGYARIINPNVVESVSTLLEADQKKFAWALVNYCVLVKGEATRRRHTDVEAAEARDVLAQGLYSRLVDWIICKINEKMAVNRAIFGDKHFISVLDLFGFECFPKNTYQQLFINCVNEQLHFFYNQRIFVWEMQEGEEDDIPVTSLQHYDNKPAVDQILAKPTGLMYILDESSRGASITEKLKEVRSSHVTSTGSADFAIAHYTGRVTYDASDFPDKNRDFLPPEMIETLRRSENNVVSSLFTGLFSKSGNLTVPADPEMLKKGKGRWGAALTAENDKIRARRYNTESRGQYSQSRQMRTLAGTFRGTCIEVLKSLAGGCGVHFVRCIRGNLTDQPGAIQSDLLKQQLKALAILDTARARQKGYPIRIAFSEFLRRYKFLAFDFDEQVDITKENCRLLLLRLKMEGWIIGRNKVFLKYYNEEFLNRLYETQVKKIVKVQSMMRAFLAKRNLQTKLENFRKSGSIEGENQSKKEKTPLGEEEAAVIIQKQIRGSIARMQYGPAINIATGKLDEATQVFIKGWCKKWRLKSIFQVLLLYRATRHQDMVYFSQQAHLYNQNFLSELKELNLEEVDLKDVDPKTPLSFIPPTRPAVHKLPFRLGELPYFDSTYISDPSMPYGNGKASQAELDESWDAPLQRPIGEKYRRCVETNYNIENGSDSTPGKLSTGKQKPYGGTLPKTPYVRDQKATRTTTFGADVKMDTKADFGKHQIYRAQKQSAPRPPVINIVKSDRSINPISEMQEKFRQNSADSDEPPFNFQAMLRKTNNKRESLKRTEGGSVSPSRNNNIVFMSPNIEKKSFVEKNNNSNDNEKKATATVEPRGDAIQLAPGVIIHGEVADL